MGMLELLIPLIIGYTEIPRDIVKQYGLQSCNCVLTARKLNPDLPYGLFTVKQKERVVNSDEPEIGATVFTKEGGWTGHAATVIMDDGNTIVTIDGNLKRCKVTIRALPKDSPKIIGYYIGEET